jgi:hypothetical protein
MIPQTSLDDALKALSYLTGQGGTVPSGERNAWIFFTVAAVQRLYRAFDFDFAQTTQEVTTDEEGVVSLGDFSTGSYPALDYINSGTSDGYIGVPAARSSEYAQGDRRFWYVVNEDGAWELHSTEPNATFNVVFWQAPEITADKKAMFTAIVIAKGALIYYRQSDDPEADTSVEEDQFRQEVIEIMDVQNRRRPQQFAQTPRDRAGTYLGRSR